MKLFVCFSLTFVVSSCLSAAIQANLTKCKNEYEANIGRLVASEGVSTVSSILRLFFNDLDLNSNNLVSASEIVIKLESEGMVGSEGMSRILTQLQTWVDVGSQDGDSELNLNEFVNLVDSTIGQTEAAPRPNMDEAESTICTYINNKMTKLMRTYADISKCVTQLKAEQISLLSSGTKRMIVNVWKGAFNTLDQNSDGIISTTEMQEGYDFYLKSDQNISAPLDATMRNNSYTSKEFFSKVHNLMFGSTSDGMWGDITTIEQLYGDCAVCFVLRSARNDVIDWVEKNMKCSNLYKDTLAETLGKDSAVAPGYIFAIADVNKNGIVTSQELEGMVEQARGKTEFKLSKLSVGTDMTSLVLSNMTRLLPDHVVKVKVHPTDDFEISILSCPQQRSWNEFCFTTIDALHTFPTTLNPIQATSSSVKTTAATAIDDCYKIIKEELENPDLQITPELKEIFNKLKEIIPSESQTTTSSSNEDTTSFTTSAVTSPQTETQTVQMTTSSETYVTNATSSPPALADVVRDVINDLSKENISASGDDITSELQKLNITENSGKSKENSLLTENERQLLDLLTNYDSNLHQNKIKGKGVVMETRNMTKEEAELQDLLNNVVG